MKYLKKIIIMSDLIKNAYPCVIWAVISQVFGFLWFGSAGFSVYRAPFISLNQDWCKKNHHTRSETQIALILYRV